ncbi:MupG family TIM beta-alpha barrel fold protein [Staphylococcus sp. ACRSN]|uniref:MupG family TIM beta-alpha barrel fold protein n=1 Tax=Staphylococcus sp. ACRSN TaxID=2918214 RepID=UPI001EF19533|nr:MupG family TIM beta-alpha barrel fold protein [Staphylococcus sp. ACRSN]MCG7338225.1 MupG family TIM beta-alpha barrel fold protein [Staphylococcus sp. ACRSN]
MAGFSIYLGEPLNEAYIKQMVDLGYNTIFTSVQIPEEDEHQKYQTLELLLDFLDTYTIQFIIDINPDLITQSFFKMLHRYSNSQFIIRIDHSTSIDIVNSIINANFKCCLNASIITPKLLTNLKEKVTDFNHIIYCHNYYPRPDTGLSQNFVLKQNNIIKTYNNSSEIYAFIAGTNKRGPIYRGLPTIESTRYQPLIISATTLLDTNTSDFIIGDPYISTYDANQLYQAINQRHFTLRVQPSYTRSFNQYSILHHHHTVRLDNPEKVIRSQEARQYHDSQVLPDNSIEREPGHITLDNTLNGRYEGELQIIKQQLPQHPNINIIAKLIDADLLLLNCIKPGDTFSFIKQTKEPK